MVDTFLARYEAVFNRVCAFLGDGWRIDRLHEDTYRIYLVNPEYRNYSISARLEKDRIHLFGSVQKSKRSNAYTSCTVSPVRDAWGIAQDIKRKVLLYAKEHIADYEADRAEELRIQDDRRILLNLLTLLISVQTYSGYYGGLCHISTVAGLSGKVVETYGKVYRLEIDGLSKDQLIKLAKFLSKLER